ncbi:MBL fold metallo-hydrolase [Microbacterium sp.]|uniref:MBL fold metallo-hydrolase n=1 Tax=Microbacterium sp. TaxID=51671 RepID=UPI002811A5BB|nr:MBL fold metallo-hydrolase [Microbacterium sp.]
MSRRSTGWTEVATGVNRLDVAHVNCYLVVAEGGMTLVDAGLPGTRPLLDSLLKRLGARRGDIDAVLLTHGHFDHVGMARGLGDEGTGLLVHPEDAALARHPYRYARERAAWRYPLRYPRTVPGLLSMGRHGALMVKGVDAAPRLADGLTLDVPGRPRVVWTPGHTYGHCAFVFEHLGVVMSGDAIVTFDPYTGAAGPQIVAGAATADSARALESLDALRSADSAILLPGHGDPWTRGVGEAIDAARRAGSH